MLLEKAGLTLMTTLSKFGVEVNGFLLAVVVAVGPRILKILVWKLAV